MGKTKPLAEGLFKGKLRFRVLKLKGHDFRDRIFYGYLAYRGNVGEGATLGEVSRATGLSRTSACLRARDHLLASDLIHEGDDSRWHADQPGESMAPVIRESDKWINRYAYDWFIPTRQGSGLALVDAWVYWLLWSMDRQNVGITSPQCLSGLGKLAGLHRVTVGTAMKTLASLGLIRVARAKGSREYFRVGMSVPTAELLEDFQDGGTHLNAMVFLDENGEELVPLNGEKLVPIYEGKSSPAEKQNSRVGLERKTGTTTIIVDDEDEDEEPQFAMDILLEEMNLNKRQIARVKELAKKCKWKSWQEFEDLVEMLDCKKKNPTVYGLLMTELARRKVRD